MWWDVLSIGGSYLLFYSLLFCLCLHSIDDEGKRRVLTSLTVKVVRKTTRSQLCRTEKNLPSQERDWPVSSGQHRSVRPRSFTHLSPALTTPSSGSCNRSQVQIPWALILQLVFGLLWSWETNQLVSDQSLKSSVFAVNSDHSNRIQQVRVVIGTEVIAIPTVECVLMRSQISSKTDDILRSIPNWRLVLTIFVQLFELNFRNYFHI